MIRLKIRLPDPSAESLAGTVFHAKVAVILASEGFYKKWKINSETISAFIFFSTIS
jgi:hypothetical protein